MEFGSLADLAMAMAAFLAVYVASKTYRAVVGQSKATEAAAVAAAKSADTAEKSLRMLNRPYLDTDDWTADLHSGPSFGDPTILTIKFNIHNPSPTPARLERVTICEGFGGHTAETIEYQTEVQGMIPPRRSQPFVVQITIGQAEWELMFRGELMVRVFGEFQYTDLFNKSRQRTKKYARYCNCRCPGHADAFVATFVTPTELGFGVGLNDEVDWDKDEEEGQPSQ